MSQEREDLVAPDLPKPNTLTMTEAHAVYRELKRGADKAKLASYFNTTITEINLVEELGSICKWK